jgi:tyrosyl-tRNA synthetase
MAEVIELSEVDQQRKDLILRNLQESLGVDKLTKQLSTGKNIHVYWGTATTGKPHVGYMVPMQKIADFLNAGIKVTILFADVHAFLDNLKSTFEMLEYRVEYYQRVIKALLSSLDVPLEKLSFVLGSSYQLSEAYTQDVLKLCGHISQRDALRAGAEVVKQVESPLLSGLLYPLLQAIDEQYLKCDGQFGGVDQRKIFILAEEQLPKIKLGKRWHLMNPMVPGLTGGKMSSSEIDSKIDLLDKPNIVSMKIESSVCVRGNSDENGVLQFFRFVVFPIVSPRLIDLGGQSYRNYDELVEAFEKKEIISADQLKEFLKAFLIGILTKVQDKCENDELQNIMDRAYSAPPELDTNELSEGFQTMLELKDMGGEKMKQIKGDCELITSAKLYQKLNTDEPLKVLWRVSAKGRVNLGHLGGLLQLKRLQALNCECSILISDIGGFLDNGKCPWNALEARSKYYEEALKQFMAAISLQNVPIRHSKENQYEKDYTLEMYKMASKVTRDTSSIVEGNTLATHLCPLYHTLDVHFADVDLLITGEEQRPFVILGQQLCQGVGLPSQAALLIPNIPGMNGERMSSSNPEQHLDPLDTVKQINKKIGSSFCEPKNIKENVALELARLIIFPLHEGKEVTIKRDEKYGGNISFKDYAALEASFAEEIIHPSDLKPFVTEKINALLEPIRTALTPQSKMITAAFPKIAKKK